MLNWFCAGNKSINHNIMQQQRALMVEQVAEEEENLGPQLISRLEVQFLVVLLHKNTNLILYIEQW